MMTVPGLAMLLFGLLLVVSQLAGPISLGRTTLDIHYMILGVTLCLVGTSATSLGLVVGSTMPAGRIRLLRALAGAHAWFSFDNAARTAAVLLAGGLASDGYVLGYWLYHQQGTLTFAYTRLTLFGLLLIAMAVQIAFSALLLGATMTGQGTTSRGGLAGT
jgi:hypothetical protein